LKEKLLTYLNCPSCAGELACLIDKAESDDIIDGELRCESCARVFPISAGVPRFAVLDEVEGDKRETATNFGWQWKHFTQTDELYADQLLGWLKPLSPDFFRDKVVLEGGCGKGRHTELVAQWGAKEIIGIDLSAAVDTAYVATRHLPNAHVIQADIYNLPLRRSFDHAFSIGVLHHLPDPKGGFESLASRVKPEGFLSAWVYGAENNEWITRFVNPVREKLTSRIDQRALLQLSKLPAASLYLATKLVYGPLNKSRSGKSIARHLFYNDYLKSIAPFGWREQHTIVFDHLVAPTAFYLSREEFESWWREVGAEDVVITWHNKNSWCGFGRLEKE
jgi:SAM-dependent methyltransferase